MSQDKIYLAFTDYLGLADKVERYCEYMGYYPESIHVDAMYTTRGNRAYCKEKGINTTWQVIEIWILSFMGDRFIIS